MHVREKSSTGFTWMHLEKKDQKAEIFKTQVKKIKGLAMQTFLRAHATFPRLRSSTT
jgi:hypothetical protein